MILYVHGFRSCGWGTKSLALRRFFGINQVLAPDLSPRPGTAIAQLEGLIGRYPVRGLVGASLGGFYATWINRRMALPAVLVNPVVRPHEKLAEHTGTHARWCDGMRFEVSDTWLTTLASMQRAALRDEERYLILLQEGDEVLDYREAAHFYGEKTLDVAAGGDHRFIAFDDHLEQISRWLNIPSADRYVAAV
jgi:predicted esterase YcpF (UPF0227 family)